MAPPIAQLIGKNAAKKKEGNNAYFEFGTGNPSFRAFGMKIYIYQYVS
jgi:hypothetical protein